KSLNDATEQIAQRFIIIDNVIIKQLKLPDRVENAIQEKIEEKHLADAHLYKIVKQKREAERKEIEANMMKRYNDIVNESLTDQVIQWMAIQATIQLAQSDNSKVIVIGGGKQGLPILGNLLLNADDNESVNSKKTDQNPKDVVKQTKDKDNASHKK
ncbi:MAG: hypothetical protein HQK77_19960, partial [Desulfobacterales bacterium]|nr:hypothetical protein [Desulfobacterales bacterium]